MPIFLPILFAVLTVALIVAFAAICLRAVDREKAV